MTVDITGDTLFDYLPKFEEVIARVEKTIVDNKPQYWMIRDNRKHAIKINGTINTPNKDKLKLLLQYNVDHIELIYWEYA